MKFFEIPGVESLRPSDVQQHLIAKGWKPGTLSNDVLRFERPSTGSTLKASLLQRTDFDDFARRMTELVELLAAVEKRSVFDIVDELSAPPGDTISFRSESELIHSGTILLNDSLRLREAQKDLLLAAAHSTLEPEPHFARMSKAKALEFLASCREGQTARGSYVMKVIVPISPAVGTVPVEPPFARLVVGKLTEALSAAHEALRHGALDGLLQQARSGVSANFLHALARMEPPGERGSLEVAVSWSRARPMEQPSPLFRFESGYAQQLASVAAALRETAQSPAFEVEGYVAALKRDPSHLDAPGVVVLATTLEGEPGTSTVRSTLSKEDYAVAIKAHALAARVRVAGTLLKKGRTWWLERPGVFRQVAAQDGDSDVSE